MQKPETKVEIVAECDWAAVVSDSKSETRPVKATPSKIEPSYHRAIFLTAQHYQTMVAFVRVQMQKE